MAHQMKGQLILGSKFLKKHFQAGSRMTKRELAQKILASVDAKNLRTGFRRPVALFTV